MPKIKHHTVTRSELEQIAQMLRECSGQIMGIAQAMKSQEIESLEVTHESQKKDAIRFIKNFTGSVHLAMIQQLGPSYESK